MCVGGNPGYWGGRSGAARVELSRSRDDNENVGCKTSLPCGMRGTQASERSNSSCLVSSVISLGDNRMSTPCDQQCMIPMAVGRLEPLARH